jgi:hypothetical protein
MLMPPVHIAVLWFAFLSGREGDGVTRVIQGLGHSPLSVTIKLHPLPDGLDTCPLLNNHLLVKCITIIMEK